MMDKQSEDFFQEVIEDHLHPIEWARITPNRELRLRLWSMTWRHRLDAAIRILLGKPIKLR